MGPGVENEKWITNAKDVLVERGTAEPVVSIECHCEEGRNVIRIRDNAGGIPQAILDKIFDPYLTTKFKSQGTGLGLYMSKMIVENNMGGRSSHTTHQKEPSSPSSFRCDYIAPSEDLSF